LQWVRKYQEVTALSTRCSLKYERDEATGQGIHLYEDLQDNRDCVMLQVEGFTFETSVSVAPSGRLDTRVQLRIPKHWARKLGLIEPAKAAGPEEN
jgi:hypothetical protein